MGLSPLDWIIIIAFILFSIGISWRYKKLGESGLSGFFLGGRNLPWYLAGLSMVATTFAADTPLAVAELVAQGGIAKNWLWWNALAGGVLTAIFFARLWRKSGVLTEVEFINIRYSGKGARFLRGFKAVYLGIFINAMIIAWVNQAFITLLQVFFDIPSDQVLWYVAGAMLLIMFYSGLSGLKGIAVTDSFQFIIAMIGCIILAIIVLNSPEIGGVSGLKAKLPPAAFNFFPSVGDSGAVAGFGMTLATMFTYVGVLWWSCWYPGAEPGGGGYIAQRMMSTKGEKDSVFATLFFQFAHYCLRPWPWIIVALCALVLYPDLEGSEQKFGFVMAMKDFLPSGLRGMLLVAFLGAYMSTISTQLNWGASYVVNDLYNPFIKPSVKSSGQGDVSISRIATVVLGLLGVYITSFVETITGVWEFIFQCGAGLGLVLIVRWFWYKVNVWAEISATLTPFIVYGVIYLKRLQFNALYEGLASEELQALQNEMWFFDFGSGVLLSVLVTTIVWVSVAYMTPQTDPEKLRTFFAKVRPAGSWGEFGTADNSDVFPLIIAWICAVVMIYAMLFAFGKIILFTLSDSIPYVIASVVGFIGFRYFAGKGDLFR